MFGGLGENFGGLPWGGDGMCVRSVYVGMGGTGDNSGGVAFVNSRRR